MAVLVHHVSLRTQIRSEVGDWSYFADKLQHGLTLFFVLSGFLLFRPFVSAVLDGRSLPSFKRYAINRFLRIWPVYAVILIIIGVIFDAAYRFGSPSTSPDDNLGRLSPLTFLADILLVQTYIPGTISTGIGPAWSLTAEIAFYAVLPLLALGSVYLARKLPRVVAVSAAPAVLIVVGVGTTLWLKSWRSGLTEGRGLSFEWGQNLSSVVARSLLGQADLFAYGMIAAIIVCVLQKRGVVSIPAWVKGAVGLLAVAIVVFALNVPIAPFTTSTMAIAAATLLLTVALPSANHERHGNVLARILEWLPFRYLGLISYSIYLWHNPVLWWLKDRGLLVDGDNKGVLLNIAIVSVITILLSSATYFLVERPAMNLRTRIGKKSQPAAPAPVDAAADAPAESAPARSGARDS